MSQYLHGNGGVYPTRMRQALNYVCWMQRNNVSLLAPRRPGSPPVLFDPEDHMDEMLDGMQNDKRLDNTLPDPDLEGLEDLFAMSNDEAPEDEAPEYDRTTPVSTSPLTLSDTESQGDEAEPRRG